MLFLMIDNEELGNTENSSYSCILVFFWSKKKPQNKTKNPSL